MACLRPQTRAMVGQIQSKIGPITIVSTCGGKHVHNSEHYRGNAVDFHPQRVSIAQAAAAARSIPGVGGVGTYASHVHADVGRARVSWNRSGPRTLLASRGRSPQHYPSRGFNARYASYRPRTRVAHYEPPTGSHRVW